MHRKFEMYLKLSLFNSIWIVVTCCLSWTKCLSSLSPVFIPLLFKSICWRRWAYKHHWFSFPAAGRWCRQLSWSCWPGRHRWRGRGHTLVLTQVELVHRFDKIVRAQNLFFVLGWLVHSKKCGFEIFLLSPLENNFFVQKMAQFGQKWLQMTTSSLFSPIALNGNA